MKPGMLASLIVLAAAPAFAQEAAPSTTAQPIEVVSDNLEVLQSENKAIFTGNVIAKQGDKTLRAKTMIVHYASSGGPDAPPPDPTEPKGITHIDAEGDVVLITPNETVQGERGIYHVKDDTIDVYDNVVLTRGENILKGGALNYNMATGRSMLQGAGKGTGRVRGLFMPSKV